MNDRQLRYAVAVWRERSFSRAAEKLGVSQPSLSEQVRLLEDEVGFSLFDRSSRGVEPSINGRTFLQNADDLVMGFSALKDLARELRGAPGTTLRLGLCSGIGPAVVPNIVTALRQLAPAVRLDLVTTTTRRIHRFVDLQRLDAGVLFEGDAKSLPHELRTKRLAETELVALLPPGHALAGAARGVDPATLAAHELIANETRVGYGRQVMALLSAQGLAPNVVADCDDLDTLKLMVAAGGGIAVVPRLAAVREIAAGTLVALPFKPRHKIGLVMVRRADALPPRIEQAVERLLQVVPAAADLVMA